jgi:hypothetical protein
MPPVTEVTNSPGAATVGVSAGGSVTIGTVQVSNPGHQTPPQAVVESVTKNNKQPVKSIEMTTETTAERTIQRVIIVFMPPAEGSQERPNGTFHVEMIAGNKQFVSTAFGPPAPGAERPLEVEVPVSQPIKASELHQAVSLHMNWTEIGHHSWKGHVLVHAYLSDGKVLTLDQPARTEFEPGKPRAEFSDLHFR